MAARAPQQQDVIGFTRIFVLFCTLVLVPALFLSGFGVIAILNERQAEKQRRHEEAEATLRRGEEAFAEILDAADRAALRALEDAQPDAALAALARSGAPIGPWLVLSRAGDVVAGTPPFVDDAPLLAHIARVAERAQPRRPAHAVVDEPAFGGVVSMQRSDDGRAVVYGIDENKVDVAVSARVAKDLVGGDIAFAIKTAHSGDEPVPNAVDRLLEIVKTKPTEDALAAHTLEVPFDRFTIVASPTAPESHFTLIAYIVLLVVFLATLITGVVVTARLIWQETRLSRLKTDFVSHMSHELRTPLTSIRMFIDTLRLHRAPSAEEQQECLDLLAKETERLSEMIERVLGYARLRAGRRLFSPTDVAVTDVVGDTLDAFRAQRLAGGGDDVAVTTEIADGLPKLHADREALVEALLNLVSNAYKYTGPDKRITVFARETRRGRVVVGVTDNGPGLPKAEHTRVFERFYQAGGLLSRKQPGSGLGLAITRAIVEGNGGKIHVESEPGKGSTFMIEMKPAELSRPRT